MSVWISPRQVLDGCRIARNHLQQIQQPIFTERFAIRALGAVIDELETRESVDWRVLGGVIPGPIPVEWVRVGDTIQDHGVTGTITRAVRSGGMVHLVIGSGHVSFAKVAQQDFITVLNASERAGGNES